MSEENLKTTFLYSIMAVSRLENGEINIHSWPDVRLAADIDDAVLYARDRAFELWPVNEGWFGHRVNIFPYDLELFQLQMRCYAAGTVKFEAYEGQNVFDLHPSP